MKVHSLLKLILICYKILNYKELEVYSFARILLMVLLILCVQDLNGLILNLLSSCFLYFFNIYLKIFFLLKLFKFL